jgi:beta-glucosidase
MLTREAVDRLALGGAAHIRFALDWAVLEPKPGVFDATETVNVRELLIYAKSRGLQPVPVLYHYTVPDWFEALGGFARPANIPLFVAYVEYIVTHLGHTASEYITLNEPCAFAVLGKQQGAFAPGIKPIVQLCNVQSVLACCHMEAYESIHELREGQGFDDTQVGFAHFGWHFAPVSEGRILHKLAAKTAAYLYQNAMLRACLSGWFDFPLKNYSELGTGLYADFFGLNTDGPDPQTLSHWPKARLKWRACPQAVTTCAQALQDMSPLPVYYIGHDNTIKKELAP